MIHAEHLRKSYGTLVAVDDVSLDIKRGETFGLLGPNGAGKSTTIHMLVGAIRPDSGSVTVNGASDPSRPEVRRGLGIAPQRVALYEDLTGQENLAFFGRLYGVTGKRLTERVEWALDFAGLKDRRHSRAKTYSGGMQRRLNLACALLPSPPILLCDEPTAGVDPQSRNHIFEIIERLKQDGLTVLYTTHYMEEAQRLCDRVAIMDRGKLLDCDTVPNLIARHGRRPVVTAELERPVNDPSTLPGQVEGTSLRFETEKPVEELMRLTRAGVVFKTFHVDQPDLESVFLTLTGRSLRD
ncbi:MAG: ABC transporter ATP-binding protein [Phycisphaerales bacterium]|nr:ABC transporter ATP-binding protein [Phycisphaerales bacterium]